MIRRYLGVFSIFGASLGVSSCLRSVDPIPQPTSEMALEMGVEEAQLVRGRALYMENCHRCHDRVLPGTIDPEYWRGIMPHMGEHARFTKSEETDVLIYLMAAHGTVHGMNLEH